MNLLDELKLVFKRSDNTVNQLILINVIVFVVLGIFNVILTLAGQEWVFDMIYSQFALPSSFHSFLLKPWTLITTFFNHSFERLFHIVSNMLFLYWFGKIIGEYIGSKKVLSLYILGGLSGSILFLLMFNIMPYYKASSPVFLVGASSSVFAIMVASATLLPEYELRLFLIGRIKLVWIVTALLFISFFGLIKSNAGGDIAHLGGAILGYFYIKQLQKGNDWGVPIIKLLYWIKNLFKPKPKIKVSYRTTSRTHSDSANKKGTSHSSVSSSKKPNQDEIDRILDKISASGYESLTKEEKQMLFQASH